MKSLGRCNNVCLTFFDGNDILAQNSFYSIGLVLIRFSFLKVKSFLVFIQLYSVSGPSTEGSMETNCLQVGPGGKSPP